LTVTVITTISLKLLATFVFLEEGEEKKVKQNQSMNTHSACGESLEAVRLKNACSLQVTFFRENAFSDFPKNI
jgi:hypothetical protein